MKYLCCEPQRLETLKRLDKANGIEWLEVRDHLEPVEALRQRTLFVRLLRPVTGLTANSLRIDGGERVPIVPIEWIAAADALPAGVDPALADGIDEPRRTLVVRTALSGDFSVYTLHLRRGVDNSEPPGGFDPKLAAIEFSFKVECAGDFDCAQSNPCGAETPAAPPIDYLAKDYTGFRRLMLDRLNLLAPGWSERSAADVGVALVELLAYAADNLSYRQDAIATEAYLATARRRTSVRRHARLVDYALHDGCNARAFVHIAVNADITLPQGTPLLTRPGTLPGALTPHALPRQLTPGSKLVDDAIEGGALVFETAHTKPLYADLGTLNFHTWGDQGCCLPRGSTRATLRGKHPDLKVGDLLVLKEAVSPTTFDASDADPHKRWVVRLVTVTAGVDPYGQLFDVPPVDAPLPVTEIEWDGADALPFALCLSAAARPGLQISVALGNIVLVDHGQTVTDPPFDPVPETRLKRIPIPADDAQPCERREAEPVPIRFRPALRRAPVAQGYDIAAEMAAPRSNDDDRWFAAGALIVRDPHAALPLISRLEGARKGIKTRWRPRLDLLSSGADALDFVLETENDGTARLRFGDGTHARRPEAGTVYTPTYRIGNGVAGNVGAETIRHIVSNASGVFDDVTNPLPAGGGIDAESIESARRDAPQAFRTQQRAVTEADYAAAAERRGDVQRAAATFRWTGSWHTVFVTADRHGGAAVDAPFEGRVRRYLERFRMAGYDLEVDSPRYVALDIALHVCVRPEYFRAQVLRAVQAELGAGTLPGARLAVFHPDNHTFGQPVYLSRVIAAAQAVPGVEAVWAEKFERYGQPDALPIETGVLPMSRLEIAQLANDPNFRERGRLTLHAGGGQ